MQWGGQGDVGADHHIVANPYRAGIQNSEVEIGEDARAELGEASIVEVDRTHKIDVLTVSGHQLVQEPTAQVMLLLGRCVEQTTKFVGLDP